jgi:hypothetical protein
VPKTDVEVVKGTKSREKTILVHNTIIRGTVEEHVERTKAALQGCVNNQHA